MLVIGLSGRARSGKTETAEAISCYARTKGVNVQTYDIGGVVREYCVANGLLPDKPREELNADELAVLVHTGKELREKNESFWLDKIRNKMWSAQPDVAVIPNVRYRNEWEWVKQSGTVVRVKALNPDGSEYISPDRDPNHPSETELHSLPADYYIVARKGEGELVRSLAVATFDHIYKKVLQ